ncbi:MAG: hypothetical protein GY737_01120 [Desulfobacteraceae bacterium]|nr:hypothetical protein [Desulfobacteraceae bacterium]
MACDKAMVMAGIENWINNIKDYRVEALVTLDQQRMHSTITGKVPDRLRIRLVPGFQKEVEWMTIFDGKHQWVEVKAARNIEVFKVKLPGLVDKQRPFDTTFYMMGSGLMNGEGFPETIRSFIRTYDLSVTCLKDRTLLTGTINANKFKEYASKRKTRLDETVVNRFMKQFRFITIEFDPVDFHVTMYQLGSDNKDPQKQNMYKVKINNLIVNQGLPKTTFKYLVPKDVEPLDITEDIKSRL